MAEVVNLRTARKQRDRAEARRRSAVRTGGAAGETERLKAETELERRRLEAHRRDGEPSRSDPPGGDRPNGEA